MARRNLYDVPGHKLRLIHKAYAAEHPDTHWPNGKWVAECACGYRSTPRISESQSVGVAIWHMEKMIDEARRKGVNVAGWKRLVTDEEVPATAQIAGKRGRSTNSSHPVNTLRVSGT